MSNTLTITNAALGEIKANFDAAEISDYTVRLSISGSENETTYEMFAIEPTEITSADVELLFDDVKVYIDSNMLSSFNNVVLTFVKGDSPQFIFTRKS